MMTILNANFVLTIINTYLMLRVYALRVLKSINLNSTTKNHTHIIIINITVHVYNNVVHILQKMILKKYVNTVRVMLLLMNVLYVKKVKSSTP